MNSPLVQGVGYPEEDACAVGVMLVEPAAAAAAAAATAAPEATAALPALRFACGTHLPTILSVQTPVFSELMTSVNRLLPRI